MKTRGKSRRELSLLLRRVVDIGVTPRLAQALVGQHLGDRLFSVTHIRWVMPDVSLKGVLPNSNADRSGDAFNNMRKAEGGMKNQNCVWGLNVCVPAAGSAGVALQSPFTMLRIILRWI